MYVQVRIPSALRTKVDGKTTIDVDADTVDGALRRLEVAYPALAPMLRDAGGTLRPKVMVYVNDVHIRLRQGVDTPLHDGDQVYVVPMVMGG
jgi:molybdopterin converting factor small subunit